MSRSAPAIASMPAASRRSAADRAICVSSAWRSSTASRSPCPDATIARRTNSASGAALTPTTRAGRPWRIATMPNAASCVSASRITGLLTL